jgi:hypothetical protein
VLVEMVPWAGLACGQALAAAGGQVAGGDCAELNGRSECGQGMENGMKLHSGELGKPRCMFIICSFSGISWH